MPSFYSLNALSSLYMWLKFKRAAWWRLHTLCDFSCIIIIKTAGVVYFPGWMPDCSAENKVKPVFHDESVNVEHPSLVSLQYVMKLFVESVVLEPVDITLRNQLLLLINNLL